MWIWWCSWAQIVCANNVCPLDSQVTETGLSPWKLQTRRIKHTVITQATQTPTATWLHLVVEIQHVGAVSPFSEDDGILLLSLQTTTLGNLTALRGDIILQRQRAEEKLRHHSCGSSFRVLSLLYLSFHCPQHHGVLLQHQHHSRWISKLPLIVCDPEFICSDTHPLT